MNAAAVLALVGDLYQQIVALTDENAALRQAVVDQRDQSPTSSSDGGV